MKITKRNGNLVLFDDEKVAGSILKANAGITLEELSEKAAAAMAGEVFARLSEGESIISTQDIRACVQELLIEKGYPLTAQAYMEYKK